LHRRPYPPFEWSSCFPRTIQLPLPASPCSRLSRPRSTIRQSDYRQGVGSSSLCQLVGPYKPGLSLTVLPCSHGILWLHASGTNPGSNSVRSPFRILSFCLPHRGIRSATSTSIDFGAIFPFTAVLACNPPCLRFAVAVTGHHARLGTRLRARLCRGLHFRRLNSLSFQGTTLYGSGRADFPHPALALGNDAQAQQRIGMTNTSRREPSRKKAPHAAPRQVVTLTATAQGRPPEIAHGFAKRAQSRAVHGYPVIAEVTCRPAGA
jgi:hypothetical protein